MINCKGIIREHYKRIKKYLRPKKVHHNANGIVLQKTNNYIFTLFGVLIDEVTDYCKSQGIEVDKVVFISLYDINFNMSSQKFNISSKSRIEIVDDREEKVAIVTICEHIDNGK